MRFRWRGDGVSLLVVLVLAVLSIVVAYARPAEISLDVGEATDLAYVGGFYEAEFSDFYSFSYRWTQERAWVRLPAVGRGRPLRLQLDIVGRFKPGQQPIEVTFSSDGRALGRIPVGPIPDGRLEPYRYIFAVPAAASPSGDLVVWFETRISSSETDARQLGLLVDRVTVLTGRGLGLPPLLPTLSLLGIGLLVYAAIRLAEWGWVTALVLSGGLVLVLAVLLHRASLWVAPYLPAFAGVAAVTCVLLFLARLVAGKQDVTLPRLFVILALLSTLFVWWQILFIPTPPSYLPASFPLVAGLAYLGVFALRRWQKPRWLDRLTPEGLFAGAVLAISLIYAVLFFVRVFGKDYATDFHALFDGVRSFFSEGALYNLEGIRRNHLGDLYKYPPFFSLVLWPLVRVPFVPALQIWRVVNLLILGIAAWLISRTYRFGQNPWLWAGFLLILFNWRPVGDTIAYGQVDILLFLLIVGVLAALRGERKVLAGFLLALATMLKLYPAFLALFFLLRREWRALVSFCLALVVLAGLSVVLLGWPVHALYLQEVLPFSGGGTPWVENQTFNGFFNRLLTDRIALTPETHRWADRVAFLVSGALIVASSWLVYRFGDRENLHYDVGFSLLLVTMLLVLPAAWLHYETILVLPFVLLFVYVQQRGTLPLRVALLAGLGFGLLCYGNVWSVFQREVYGRFWQLLLSYKVYGMMLLWLGLALLLWRSRGAGLGSSGFVPPVASDEV
jgi:hypothetical protein